MNKFKKRIQFGPRGLKIVDPDSRKNYPHGLQKYGNRGFELYLAILALWKIPWKAAAFQARLSDPSQVPSHPKKHIEHSIRAANNDPFHGVSSAQAGT